MYNIDTELMFPPRVIAQLRPVRGVDWQNLIDRVSDKDSSLLDRSAFVLLMVRLGGCQGCSIDSFRGMRGCSACARQTVRRFRGSDKDLVHQFEQAREEIERFMQKP